jgi:uncharacterized protein YgbK (DUF1537 family)
LVGYETVGAGTEAIGRTFTALQDNGVEIAVVDAISNDDLSRIGAACADLPLVTAGSGLALGLPQNFRRKALLQSDAAAAVLPRVGGRRAVIAGSCSTATRGQVAAMIAAQQPAFNIDPLRLARGEDLAQAALAWAQPKLAAGPVMIYATAAPEDVKAAQAQLGVERAGQIVEHALAAIARGLVALGVRRLVVAGGETAGAVVNALGVKGLRIGAQIDPGVPWTVSLDDAPIGLALKSGNFGAPDFFLKAWDRLP